MKICHLADSHLGAGETYPRRGENGLTLRQEDILKGFTEAVDKIIGIRPDICLHAGDIFHKVQTSNRIIALTGYQLHRLAVEHQIPTVIIAGNHDAPKQPHKGAALEIFNKLDNLYISAASQLEVFKIKEASVFALPHCLTTEVLKTELEKCRPDPESKYNILMLHGVASGMPEFSMADLGEQEIPVEIMKPFDYTALGHFHNYTSVAPKAFYSGSTERLSQSEREAPKGFIEVALDPFEVTFHEVASRVMVDVKPIDTTGLRGDQVAEVIKRELEEVDSSDKIVRVKLEGVTEETMKTLPMETIRELKNKSYAFDLKIERREKKDGGIEFGRSGIGRLDESFVEFLDRQDLTGFDRQRIIKEALKYLSDE